MIDDNRGGPVTDRLTKTLRPVRWPITGAFGLLLVTAACGAPASPSAPAWSFAVGPSTTPLASTSVVSAGSAAPPTLSESASVSAPGGLERTCAGQWAASLKTYEEGVAGSITIVLFPRYGGDTPAIRPTSAALQTDMGPLELAVASVSTDENDTVWGTVRLDLGLPRLTTGLYRAEAIDLTDSTGTWRFQVGDFAIRVLSGSAPSDILRVSGTAESGAAEGGSVQGFEVTLRNTAASLLEVTGVSTDIPGLPVNWFLGQRDPNRIVASIKIAAGKETTVLVGTEETARTVAFVLATREIAYHVGGSGERRALLDPIVFESGFSQPSDATAYAVALPLEACARRL